MTADKAREISEAARKRIAELPNNVFHLTSK